MKNMKNTKNATIKRSVLGLFAGMSLITAMPMSAFAAPADAAIPMKEVNIVVEKADGTKTRMTIDDYLSSLKVDKGEVLRAEGDNISTFKKSETKSDSSGFTIIKRERKTAKNNTADISVVGAGTNDIFPGALLRADKDLVDGNPTPITGLKRNGVIVYVDIPGNKSAGTYVENPTKGSVTAAINKQLDDWYKDPTNVASAKVNYNVVDCVSEKQLDAKLGMANAAETFKVDFEANAKNNKKSILLDFTQIYYSALVDVATGDDLFDDSVTAEDVAKKINEKNPAAVEVSRVDYGRRIVVKVDTEDADIAAKLGVDFNTGAVKSKGNSVAIKDVFKKANYTIFVYGGSGETVKELVTSNLEDVNKAIAKEMCYSKGTPGEIISYKTNFIHDGSAAKVNRSTDYIETTTEKRGPVTLDIHKPGLYGLNHMIVWGRKIVDIDDNGSYVFGKWEQILYRGDKCDVHTKFDGAYAEFAFSMDMTGTLKWPYSNQFWWASSGAVKDIDIDLGGGWMRPQIIIKVNGKTIVNQHDFGAHNKEWKPAD